LALAVAFACSSETDAPPASGTAGTTPGGQGGVAGRTAGVAGTRVAGGAAGEASGGAAGGDAGSAGEGGGGSGGEAGETSGASGAGEPSAGASGGGQAGEAGASGSGGGSEQPLDLEDLVENGEAGVATQARSSFGALAIATDGERVYAVEGRRDIEAGPFGLPWRSRFRLAAYDGASETWAFPAEPDDVVSDVAVHPSGDVTIAVLRHPPSRMAYDLVRFDRSGKPLGTTTLPAPATIPESDYGAEDPRPLFRMKSDFADANVGGWVRLLPDGEGLYVAFLSYVDASDTDPLSTRLATGVATFAWAAGSGYAERWARVVEGMHGAEPAAWAYDELRWRDQAVRPFLAHDALTGDVLVGRAWNNLRCRANVAAFAEFTSEDCVFRAVPAGENERLPFAVTRFDESGARLGTIVLAPDDDAPEQLAFSFAARGGALAVAGAIVRENPDGSKRTYPDPSGFVDYDGYIAVYDAGGERLFHHDFNLGRGDVLAALRWTSEGFLAAGSAGWDRWEGGMSISRGADPFFAWLSPDGGEAASRVIPLSDGSRHFNVHDIAVSGRSLVAHGFSDAPMTHSADGGNDAARTFGALRIRLSAP
jgi:hypothetical protein